NATSINAVPTGAIITCNNGQLNGGLGVGANPCPASGGGTIALGSVTLPPSSLCWDPSITSGPAHTAACAGGQTTVLPGGTTGPKCGDGLNGAPSPCDLMGVDP